MFGLQKIGGKSYFREARVNFVSLQVSELDILSGLKAEDSSSENHAKHD